MKVKMIRDNRAEIKARLRRAVESAVGRAALFCAGEAQAAAPEESGALKASIVAVDAPGLGSAIVWNVEVGVPYGPEVEAEHPFLAPAFASARDALTADLHRIGQK